MGEAMEVDLTKTLPLARFVRPERSFESFSRAAEHLDSIVDQRNGDHNPHAERIIDAFDLTIFEWHYWRKIAEEGER